MIRRGLTIIELMISMALGLGIMLMAFAALRATQQAYRVATSEREINRLLMLGYRLGMHELDHWLAYDNPEIPSGQPLRAPGQFFASVDLDDAYWRLCPSDPRSWDRSGRLSYRLRWSFHSDWNLTYRWHPDHAQVGGHDHPDAETRLLARAQAALAAQGGAILATDYVPGHLPLGTLRNSVGWGSGHVQNRNTFAHEGLAPVIFRNVTQFTGTTDNNADGVFYHAARWGRLAPAEKTLHFAPRPGWSTVPRSDNHAYQQLSASATIWAAGGLIQVLNPPPAVTIDPFLAYAGNPAFHSDDQQRLSYRLEVRRALVAGIASQTMTGGEQDRQVRVLIEDNESGREVVIGFRAVGSTLRGARIMRGLDR